MPGITLTPAPQLPMPSQATMLANSMLGAGIPISGAASAMAPGMNQMTEGMQQLVKMIAKRAVAAQKAASPVPYGTVDPLQAGPNLPY